LIPAETASIGRTGYPRPGSGSRRGRSSPSPAPTTAAASDRARSPGPVSVRSWSGCVGGVFHLLSGHPPVAAPTAALSPWWRRATVALQCRRPVRGCGRGTCGARARAVGAGPRLGAAAQVRLTPLYRGPTCWYGQRGLSARQPGH
jgi:hypothetical protein